jgi:hypothetical protein
MVTDDGKVSEGTTVASAEPRSLRARLAPWLRRIKAANDVREGLTATALVLIYLAAVVVAVVRSFSPPEPDCTSRSLDDLRRCYGKGRAASGDTFDLGDGPLGDRVTFAQRLKKDSVWPSDKEDGSVWVVAGKWIEVSAGASSLIMCKNTYSGVTKPYRDQVKLLDDLTKSGDKAIITGIIARIDRDALELKDCLVLRDPS